MVAAAVLRGAAINAGWARQLIPAPDAGQIALDWWQGETSGNVPADTPILLVFHGVTGAMQTPDPAAFQPPAPMRKMLHP